MKKSIVCGDRPVEISYRPRTTDEAVMREILEENVYQMKEDEVIGRNVIDIGANIGIFSVWAATHGAKRVISFEPNVENYDLLKENSVPFEGIITPMPLAVTDGPGFVRMYGRYGDSQAYTSAATSPDAVRSYGLSECLRTLDSAVVKIDAEGSEYGIIRGASNVCMKKVSYLAMEYHKTGPSEFGEMVAKLSRTHNIHLFGSYETGGYLYARIY